MSYVVRRSNLLRSSVVTLTIAIGLIFLVGCQPSESNESQRPTQPAGQDSAQPTAEPQQPDPTRAPEPTRQATASNPASSSSASDEFVACAAEIVGRELATKIVVDDGVVELPDADGTEITSDQFEAVFRCAGVAPPDTSDLTTRPIPTSQPLVRPTIVAGLPTTPPSSTGNEAVNEFRDCVANSLGQSVAGLVDIFDGQVVFLGTPPSDPRQIDSIFKCATDGSLVTDPTIPQPTSLPSDPASRPLTAQDQAFQECLAGSFRNDLAIALTLTQGGLPNFTAIAEDEMSNTDFQTVVDCVPNLGEQLTVRELTSSEQSAAQSIADAASESIVFIETNLGSAGVGFFLTADGLLVTNHHVVDGSSKFFVWMKDGTKLTATYLGGQAIPDIAVLEINETVTVTPLPTGTANTLSVGDHLITVGHPAGVGNWVSSIGEFLGSEVVSKSSSDSSSVPVESIELLTTLPATRGNSGSPIFDDQGIVVGVVHAGTRRESTQQSGRPIVSSYSASENQIITSSTQAVPIELALEIAARLSGNDSLLPSTSVIVPQISRIITDGHRDCLTRAAGPLGNKIDAFSGGLPDFTALEQESLTATQFDDVIRCLPGLHPVPTATKLAENRSSDALDANTQGVLTDVANSARESVVYLDLGGTAIGTGFVISPDGLILTNHHNIDGLSDPIVAWTVDGERYVATVINSVAQPDIALLKISPSQPLKPLALATNTPATAGEPVVIVGHPGGMGNWVMTMGAFERSRVAFDVDLTQISESVFTAGSMGGNSGSPVLNAKGEVVGIIWSGVDPTSDRNLLDPDPPIPSDPTIRQYLTISYHSVAVAIEQVHARIAAWQ